MFRSAQNLRLAADMRALQRVAAPWREARSTWFDGTPESLEARLAATERVLTYARGGVTQAHIALEREASIARAELKEAAHRLMVDFLDDGARAFKGSKRVAGEVSDFFDDGYRVVPDEEETNFHYDPDDYDEHIQIKKPHHGSKRVAGIPDEHVCDHCGLISEPQDVYEEGRCPDCGQRSEDPRAPLPDYMQPGYRSPYRENNHGHWEDDLMPGGGPGAPQDGPGKHRANEQDYADWEAKVSEMRRKAGKVNDWVADKSEKVKDFFGGEEGLDEDQVKDWHRRHTLQLTNGEDGKSHHANLGHRLMVDFLDDGARAFKGSKRVAGSRYFNDAGEPLMSGEQARFEDALDQDSAADRAYDDHYDDYGPDYDDDDDEGTIHGQHPNEYREDKEWMDFRASRHSSRRNADKDMALSTDSGTAATPLSSMPTAPTVEMGGSASASIPGAIGKMLWNGSTMTGQEPPADHAADLAAAKMGYRSAAFLPDFDDSLLFGD